MRGLSLLDIVIILFVIALLAFAASHDFARYNNRTFPARPVTTVAPGV